jgi:hypothetical protein
MAWRFSASLGGSAAQQCEATIQAAERSTSGFCKRLLESGPVHRELWVASQQPLELTDDLVAYTTVGFAR